MISNLFPDNLYRVILDWILNHGLKFTLIIIGAYVVHKVATRFIEKLVRNTVVAREGVSKEAEIKREDTLIRVFNGALHTIWMVVVSLVILGELGIETAPIIAAAGIAGLAFGFGGQYLIRDIISGLFIILENQFRVGDVVCLDDT